MTVTLDSIFIFLQLGLIPTIHGVSSSQCSLRNTPPTSTYDPFHLKRTINILESVEQRNGTFSIIITLYTLTYSVQSTISSAIFSHSDSLISHPTITTDFTTSFYTAISTDILVASIATESISSTTITSAKIQNDDINNSPESFGNQNSPIKQNLGSSRSDLMTESLVSENDDIIDTQISIQIPVEELNTNSGNTDITTDMKNHILESGQTNSNENTSENYGVSSSKNDSFHSTLQTSTEKILKERFNFASFDCGAQIQSTNPGSKSATNIIVEDKDRYMINKCSSDNKFVVIELCDTILVDMIHLANFEFFSSMFHSVKVFGNHRYPQTIETPWKLIQVLEAANIRSIQVKSQQIDS